MTRIKITKELILSLHLLNLSKKQVATHLEIPISILTQGLEQLQLKKLRFNKEDLETLPDLELPEVIDTHTFTMYAVDPAPVIQPVTTTSYIQTDWFGENDSTIVTPFIIRGDTLFVAGQTVSSAVSTLHGLNPVRQPVYNTLTQERLAATLNDITFNSEQIINHQVLTQTNTGELIWSEPSTTSPLSFEEITAAYNLDGSPFTPLTEEERLQNLAETVGELEQAEEWEDEENNGDEEWQEERERIAEIEFDDARDNFLANERIREEERESIRETFSHNWLMGERIDDDDIESLPF